MTGTATIAEFVATARSFVGTPYQHRGRTPGVALDCVGVPIVALRRCGVDVAEPPPYGTLPTGQALLEGLASYCDIVDAPQLGDLVAIFWGSEPRHCAVIVDVRRDGSVWMVHAQAIVGRVTCGSLRARCRVHSYWRARGLT